MSAIDTHPESLDGDSTTLKSQRVWKAAGKQDLDFDSQRLRNRLRAKMFGVDAAPINIGRFNVLETVGSGGMGVVYAAYDEELDRRVAVKLLRSSHHEDASIGKGRLLREAQALAKLSHPNVVQVYDVGTFDDNVFLAMEFLPGPTLRSWILDGEQPWQDVLRHFIEAGQGLAAAHREGIIHRDFKPANLLFGSDGRVRVVDFGLARAAEHARVEPDPTPSGRARAFAIELTQTGEIMGTPAYMSPEQARYERVDARSDQYSFCVALYEALFGRRPHIGRSSAEVLVAVAEGDVQPPPRTSKVPTRIVRAVMRGLSASPDHRFPTMDALLAELSVDRTARWQWLGGGAVIAASLGAFFFVSDAPCPGFDDALNNAWGPETRTELEEAFVATGAKGAAATASRVSTHLDEYANQWLDSRQDVCDAHLVRRDESAQLHDMRMACLFERRAELGALTRVLVEPDILTVQNAATAVAELSALSACDDIESMKNVVGEDEEARDLRAQLAEAKAWYKLGRHEQSLGALAAVAEQAKERDISRVEAAARYHRGIVLGRESNHRAAAEELEAAVDLAESVGDDALAVSSWEAFARALALQGDDKAASSAIRKADAKLSRIGDNESLRLDVLEARARVAQEAGRLDEAIDGQLRVVEGRRATLADDDPRLGSSLNDLANVLAYAGRLDDAAKWRAEAREVLEKAYGPSHPRLADVVCSGGIDLRDAGRLDEARAAYLKAEQILLDSVGEDSPTLFKVHRALADIALATEDYVEAEFRGERMLASSSAQTSSFDLKLDALSALANVAAKTDQPRRAETHIREYLEILATENVHPEYQEFGVYLRVGLAEALGAQGRHDEAAEVARAVVPEVEGNESLAGLLESSRKVIADAEAASSPSATN